MQVKKYMHHTLRQAEPHVIVMHVLPVRCWTVVDVTCLSLRMRFRMPGPNAKYSSKHNFTCMYFQSGADSVGCDFFLVTRDA